MGKTGKTGKTGKGKKKKGGMSTVDVIGLGLESVNSIMNIISTIGEEKRKTEEVRLEGVKIKADIEDKINQRENETVRVLKEYEIKLKQIDQEIKSMEVQSEETLKRLEVEEKRNQRDHEYRMKGLDIIEKVIDLAYAKHQEYQGASVIVNNGESYCVNVELLDKLNDTIRSLTPVVMQLNLGGYLSAEEEEQ